MPQSTSGKKKAMKPKKPLKPEIDCNLCRGTERAWGGPSCPTCPLYRRAHYADGIGSSIADYFCVAESPNLSGPSGALTKHTTWQDDVEKVVITAFSDLKKTNPAYGRLEGRYTFAVHCAENKTKKSMQEACYPLFTEELLTRSKEGQPIMVFALGAAVLKSMGFKFGKYATIQGKLLKTTIEGRETYVFASFSKRQLLAKTGYFDVLQQHLRIFLDTVKAVHRGEKIRTVVPLDELTKDYVFPQTVDEVRRLVESVIDYSRPGVDPKNHVISIDTETNTLNPHRKKLKILSIVVGWDNGLAASIPLEHVESPWTLEEVRPYVSKLLQCSKPKVMHNAKFDLKVLERKGFAVNRLAWDTMIGEHLLSEDKKGNYGLKDLTAVNIPKYAGYDDNLRAIQDQAAQDAGATKSTGLKGAAKKLAEDDGFSAIALKPLNEYGAIDADVTRQICTIQRKRIVVEDQAIAQARKNLSTNAYFQSVAKPGTTDKNPLTQIMFQRSIPVTKVLAAMELYGMAVDRDYLHDLTMELDSTILDLHITLRTMVNNPGGEQFNPNSAPQVRKIIFGHGYKHPETGKIVTYSGVIPEEDIPLTDGGEKQVDAKFLKLLRNTYNCVFADTLLKYRAVSKARTTFIENIALLTKEDGRMHTSFHIPGTATGRLSSSDENMQNIPYYIGKYNIKKIFVPTDRETYVIMNADAKAAEVRLYAAYSGDQNLIKALNDGMDPHSFFASTVYNPASVLQGITDMEARKQIVNTIGIDLDHDWSYGDFQNRNNFTHNDPTYGKQLDILRKNIKRVVFGILYGAGKGNISTIVGITKEQAGAIIDVLFRMFPTIPRYIQMTKEQVRYLGMVETFIGRRRRFQLRGMTRYQRAKAERQAVNFKIQSTSSDIVMDVMCSLDEPIRDLGGHLLITVHDSVVAEVPKKYVHQLPDLINHYGVKLVAQKYPWLPVPFSWDVEVGPSYGEVVSIEQYLSNNAIDPSRKLDLDELEVRQEFTALGS